jgi:putative heme-binding domain-containing protein
MRFAVTLVFAGSLLAQTEQIKNPLTSPKDIEAGAKIFRSHCAECHGLNGEGGRGPRLTSGEFYHGSSDADLLRNISDGIPGTEMPGVFFSPAQVWQVVAYVRSLSEQGAKESVPGDPASGRRIFRGKGGCPACHLVRGEGGRQGPDLSYIGSQRSAAHLRESILKPSARVEMEYWTARLKTVQGEAVEGYVLNEDTHSIQLLDAKDRLRSIPKTAIREQSIDKTSRMPSYEGKLSDQELDDLVAYLKSLRRERRLEQ